MSQYSNLEIMEHFDENSIPDLDVVLLGALEKFMRDGLSEIEFPSFDKPLIGASVNALTTAKMLFGERAQYVDENTLREDVESLAKQCDGAIVFSASGGKHAPILAKQFQELGLDTYAVTCTNGSQVEGVVGREKTIVTKKNREPYTYNTSTYLGWMFSGVSMDVQDVKELYDFILKEVDPVIPKNIHEHFGYYLLVPNTAGYVGNLFDVKFEELFGTLVPWQTHTFETSMHAKTVIAPQYCLAFGEGELPVHVYEENTFRVPLPENFTNAHVMAIGYYVIGKIQRGKHPYFKESLKSYILENKKKGEFAQAINLIVE
ncbi:MAG: hypothetical protein VX028_02905 [Nanoarchaeota archaeon]|nr:hypothetical protein [Nanoarchaeota archaeon]